MELTAQECGFDTGIDTLSLGRAVAQSDAVPMSIVQTGNDVGIQGCWPVSGRLFHGEKGKENLSVKAKLCSLKVNKSREFSVSLARVSG